MPGQQVLALSIARGVGGVLLELSLRGMKEFLGNDRWRDSWEVNPFFAGCRFSTGLILWTSFEGLF